MTDLPGVFGTVAPYIDDYGYFAVAALIFLANLGLPVPAEATLVVAAIYTVSGELVCSRRWWSPGRRRCSASAPDSPSGGTAAARSPCAWAVGSG